MPTAAIARTSWDLASSTIPAMAVTVRSSGGGADGPGRLDPLAEARQLGAVDERAPAIVRVRSATWNLMELVPQSMHGVALRGARQDARKARRIGGIEVVGEAEASEPHPPTAVRVLALDGERPGAPPVRDHVRDLRRAAVRGIPDAPLVHGHGPDPPGWPGELAQELVERPGIPIELGDGHVERIEHALHVRAIDRERRLEDRRPLLEPEPVGRQQLLDVHELGTDLDGLAGARQEVDLVALLRADGGQMTPAVLGNARARTERAPLPAARAPCHVRPFRGAPARRRGADPARSVGVRPGRRSCR